MATQIYSIDFETCSLAWMDGMNQRLPEELTDTVQGSRQMALVLRGVTCLVASEAWLVHSGVVWERPVERETC